MYSGPERVTYATAPAAPTENVNVLLAGVTRVHAPVPFWTANQIGTSLGSQLAKLKPRFPLPPGGNVT